MMYVIRKIIITTIVKLINLILIQRINLISKNFSLLLFKIIEMQQSFLIVYKIVKKKNYWDSWEDKLSIRFLIFVLKWLKLDIILLFIIYMS